MRRAVLAVFIAVVVVLALFMAKLLTERHPDRSGQRPTPPTGSSTGTSTLSPTASRPIQLPAGVHTASGDVITTDYGPVQVQVTTGAGRITQVRALQLPNANPEDLRLSKPAAAQLAAAVVAAQSAQVDTISGATYTSEGYLQSLQSALDRLVR